VKCCIPLAKGNTILEVSLAAALFQVVNPIQPLFHFPSTILQFVDHSNGQRAGEPKGNK